MKYFLKEKFAGAGRERNHGSTCLSLHLLQRQSEMRNILKSLIYVRRSTISSLRLSEIDSILVLKIVVIVAIVESRRR